MTSLLFIRVSQFRPGICLAADAIKNQAAIKTILVPDKSS